jgi:PTS system cellobiose-specific IIA component
MEIQKIVMTLIINSGDAKNYSIEAIDAARNNDITKAKELIKKADKELIEAHRVQTSLIQNEARGDKIVIELLMVHAQDHLMNAITVKDLAEQFIFMYEKFNKEVK